MKHLRTAAVVLFTISLFTAHIHAQSTPKEIVDIGKLDRSMTIRHAKTRPFKNPKEAKQFHHKKTAMIKHNKHTKRTIYPKPHHRPSQYGYYERDKPLVGYYDDRPYLHRPHAKPHRYTKRGWVLAYKYDRAGFYDREGFYYGYFNRNGYFFEGEFYRYDRYYRYSDRVRGRGLFDRYYYRPARWRYYGL
ncbi:MAG: hypothetical protein L3J47_04055 [Sulfurovum sp.]|nr:hypothetical protein [Sulfurovum sp.]